VDRFEQLEDVDEVHSANRSLPIPTHVGLTDAERRGAGPTASVRERARSAITDADVSNLVDGPGMMPICKRLSDDPRAIRRSLGAGR
jgi:hypothetical protein